MVSPWMSSAKLKGKNPPYKFNVEQIKIFHSNEIMLPLLPVFISTFSLPFGISLPFLSLSFRTKMWNFPLVNVCVKALKVNLSRLLAHLTWSVANNLIFAFCVLASWLSELKNLDLFNLSWNWGRGSRKTLLFNKMKLKFQKYVIFF